MLTKAEIQSIDYVGNTCTVRIPLFENAGNNYPVILDAVISNTPGLYNGYLPGDIVFVGFADNNINKVVVIGKLYLGTAIENETSRGVINCSSGTITNDFSMPYDAKLTSADIGNNVGVSGNITTYKDVKDILESLAGTNSTKVEDDSYFGNVLCRGPITNLYGGGPVNHNYTAIDMGEYYLILKDGSSNLGANDVKTYMKYMTGKYIIPGKSYPDEYCGSFTFTDGSTCYPVYTGTELRLYKSSESTKKVVEKIIEESEVTTTTDLTGIEVTIKKDSSVVTKDVNTGNEKTDKQVKLIDIEEAK